MKKRAKRSALARLLLPGACFIGLLITTTQVQAVTESPKRADYFWNTIGIAMHAEAGTDPQFNNIIKPALSDLGVKYFRTSGISLLDTNTPNRIKEICDLFGMQVLLNHGKADNTSQNMEANVNLALQVVTAPDIVGFEGPNEWSKYDPDYDGVDGRLGIAPDGFIHVGSKSKFDEGLSYGTWHNDVKNYMIAFEDYLVNTKGWSKAIVSPSIWGRRIHGYQKLATKNTDENCTKSNLHYYTRYNPAFYVVPLRSGPRPMLEAINDAKGLKNGPLWVTETGYFTGDDSTEPGTATVTEAVHAKYVPRLITEFVNRGAEKVFIYELSEIDSTSCGLTTASGRRKPAFNALKNLVKLVKDTNPNAGGFSREDLTFTLLNKNADTHYTLLQKADGSGNPGRHYLLIWQEIDSMVYGNYTPRSITLQFAPGVTKNVRMATPLNDDGYVNLTPTSKKNSVDLSVPDHVLVLEIW